MGRIYVSKNVLIGVFGKGYNEIGPHIKSIEEITPVNAIRMRKDIERKWMK
jgi:hypothetical protein